MDPVAKPVRLGWTPRTKTVAAFLAGLVIGAFSMFEIVPADSLRGGNRLASDDQVVDAADGAVVDGEEAAATEAGAEAATGTASGSGPAAAQGAGAAKGGATAAASAKGLTCTKAGNGGATDRGVTKDRIKLATTVVDSGPGSSFQSEMKDAMEAVVRQVNRAGGVCGRLLSIEYKDDAWNPQTGAGYLRTFIQQGIFAIPVGASSEGVNALAETGDFDTTKTPVVGSDGLEIGQYQMKGTPTAQPWIWPVATATVASARIMVNEAYARGARKFGVVYDNTYKFGSEAADAFKAEVARLPGTIPLGDKCEQRFCGIQNGLNSYSTDSARFYGGGPDFVGLFLEPGTALTWMGDTNTPAANNVARIKWGYGGAQPLFTNKFGSDCGGRCDGMRVWTGFKPFIEEYVGDPKVREYVTAMKSVKPGIDYFNQFSQGAFVGMQLLVQALREVGPELTRDRLRDVLNRTTLSTGLAIQDNLTFTPNTRFANTTMRGFDMQYKGTWGGWRAGPTVTDPRPDAGTK